MKTRNVKPALKYVLALVVAASSSGLMVSGQVPQPIGTWAATGAISDSRVGAASAVLDDGRTLVSGGAVAGAILGAIIGGGKGAAIGGAIGGGAGTAAVMAGEPKPATCPAGTDVTARILSPVALNFEK